MAKTCMPIRETRRKYVSISAAGALSAPNGVLAFSPAQSGGAAAAIAAVAYLGSRLATESVKRAVYFWIHAGPIVMHYKFTRWYLGQTKATLEKRDRVYNELHDRYCQKSLDIALHLKGLYAKVGTRYCLSNDLP